MTRAYRAFLLLFIAAGGFVVYSGLRLKYYGVLGPGPGFFPVWVGVLLVAACLLALGENLREGASSASFFSDPASGRRVLWVLLSLAALWLALKFAGFRLAMLGFVLVVPQVFGRQRPGRWLAVSLVLSFGVAYVFERWLGVELPAPALDSLQALSL